MDKITTEYLSAELQRLDKLDEVVTSVRLSVIKMTAFLEFPLHDAARLRVIDRLIEGNLLQLPAREWDQFVDRVIAEVHDDED